MAFYKLFKLLTKEFVIINEQKADEVYENIIASVESDLDFALVVLKFNYKVWMKS